MLTFLIIAFIGYLLFRLVFDLVLPVYRTTKKVKQTFRDMSARMNQANGQEKMQAHTDTATPHKSSTGKPAQNKKQPSSDYIDFEEVKN